MRRLLLALTLLAVAVAIPAGATGASTPAAKTYTVKVADDSFTPTKRTIHVNDIVKWVWVGADGKPGETVNEHTIVDATADKWKSKTKLKGTFSHRFKTAGKFTVVCGEHSEDMILKVTVKKY